MAHAQESRMIMQQAIQQTSWSSQPGVTYCKGLAVTFVQPEVGIVLSTPIFNESSLQGGLAV